MKSRLIVIVLGSLSLFLLSAAVLSWYENQYSMEIVKDQHINDSQLPTKVLIVTQGSEFKNKLSGLLTEKISQMSVYAKVTDVSRLPTITYDDWDAIVIIHTWEYFMPEKHVKHFVDGLDETDKLIVVTTSGLGKEGLIGVDGISSASILIEVKPLNEKIMTEIKDHLKNK
jgi:hypothetical protein